MPARFGGTWRRLRIDTQQQQGHPRFLGSKRQTAACGQIKLRHPPPAFDHHRPHPAAPQSIDACTQQCFRILRKHEKARLWRTAQLSPTSALHHPAANRTLASQPDYRLGVFRVSDCQCQNKACASRGVLGTGGKNLMHTAKRETTTKCSIYNSRACLPLADRRVWPCNNQGRGQQFADIDSHLFIICSIFSNWSRR